MEINHSNLKEISNPIGILNLIANYLDEKGFDAQTLFSQYSIELEDLQNNLLPVSLHTQGSILKAVEALTGCDHVGLIIGRKAQLANIGPLRFLVLNAETIRDALESLFSYGVMWYRGQKLDIKEEEGYARICMRIDGDLPGADQYHTAYLAAMVSIIELILGKAWAPTMVRIAYPKPKSAHVYEKIFGCPVWFGQSQHEILFPQNLLDQKRIGHDRQLDQFLRQHLSEMQSHEHVDLVSQISKIIEELLPYRNCTMDRVAEYFSVNRFTLYRYLNRQQTTFEDLLDNTRKTLSANLLKNKTLMIIDVANQVGYDDQANFTRAFKRWYGMTPGRWRRAQLAA